MYKRQLWDDFFIESCADWAVPYLAALVGLPPDAGRLEVAYAVSLRRRKGTPAALEDFVTVLTGWTARAVEGWQVTTSAQRPDHPVVRHASLDLRTRRHARVGTPFERGVRTVTPGRRWSPTAATALVWPWELRTHRRSRARPLGNRRYALHPLGLDVPLYVRPRLRTPATDEEPIRRTGDELDAPVRATYAVLEALARPGEVTYGDAWKLADTHAVASEPADTSDEPRLVELYSGSDPIPWHALRFGAVPAATPPGSGEVVVDVMRGRVELGAGFSGGVRAVWHRPVAGRLGALAADARPDVAAQIVITVDPKRPEAALRVKRLKSAFELAATLSAGLDPARDGRADVEIRLETSDHLPVPPAQSLARDGQRWRLVAPSLMTPMIRGELSLDIEGAALVLAGFYLDGDLRLGNRLTDVLIDGVTMNPARGATLWVDDGAWALALEARRSILAPIRADLAAAPIRLVDCIVDGLGRRLAPCGPPPATPTLRPAVDRKDRFAPGVSADGVTFVGRVLSETVSAADSVFVHGVEAVRVQDGCLRCCYVGPDETDPKHPVRYRCLTAPAPAFVSDAFEAGGYYALDLELPQPLLSAAGDGGEAGAYHHARRAAGLARLRERIHEFVPLGLRGRVEMAPWEEA